MSQVLLLDVAPDPVGPGALLAVIVLVMGFIVLRAVGLVLFLWYRNAACSRARSIEQTEPTLMSTDGY